MKKNLILTGRPGVGKTTLVITVVERLCSPVRGFYTAEIREGGRRVGFSLNVFGKPSRVLAHVKIRSPHRVGKYGVDVAGFESNAVGEIEEGAQEGAIVLVDEVGKMELFSDRFRKAVVAALDSPARVLATLMVKRIPFTDRIRQRRDVTVIEVTETNRDGLVEELAREFGEAEKE
jgi:nucleoside-triphosphatase